jgi:putative chitinase
VQTEIDARYAGSGIDIVNNPSCIVEPRGGLVSAMGYWSSRRMSPMADAGDTDATVDRITRVINGNARAEVLVERRGFYQTTMAVFRTPECVDRNKPSSAARIAMPPRS